MSTAQNVDTPMQVGMAVICQNPEQCFEKIMDIRSRVGCDVFTGVFSYGGVPYEESERSLRLFASEVLPRLQQLGERAVA